MTPKEKAIDLVDKFNPYALDSASDKSRGGEVSAKQCALIAVDEIIEQWIYIDTYLGNGNGELNPNLKYWTEVKTELQKL